MQHYLKAGDTLSGQEATAQMIIREDTGSRIEELFYAKDLEATVDLKKSAVNVLGFRGEQHKPNGWSGSGTMNIFYITSLFRKLSLTYIKTGKPVYFDLVVTNQDPGSTVGAQTVILKSCTLDSVTVAKFDTEAEVLEESVSFTFDDLDMIEEFNSPTLGTI